jgi:hypothetical protein
VTVCYVYDRRLVQWRIVLHSEPQDCMVTRLRIASCWMVPGTVQPNA